MLAYGLSFWNAASDNDFNPATYVARILRETGKGGKNSEGSGVRAPVIANSTRLNVSSPVFSHGGQSRQCPFLILQESRNLTLRRKIIR